MINKINIIIKKYRKIFFEDLYIIKFVEILSPINSVIKNNKISNIAMLYPKIPVYVKNIVMVRSMEIIIPTALKEK